MLLACRRLIDLVALLRCSLIPCALLAETQLIVQTAIGKSIRFLIIVSFNVPEAYYRAKLRHLVDTFDQRLPKVQIRNSVAFGISPPIHFPFLYVLCDPIDDVSRVAFDDKMLDTTVWTFTRNLPAIADILHAYFDPLSSSDKLGALAGVRCAIWLAYDPRFIERLVRGTQIYPIRRGLCRGSTFETASTVNSNDQGVSVAVVDVALWAIVACPRTSDVKKALVFHFEIRYLGVAFFVMSQEWILVKFAIDGGTTWMVFRLVIIRRGGWWEERFEV